jgi:hypothetical protein
LPAGVDIGAHLKETVRHSVIEMFDYRDACIAQLPGICQRFIVATGPSANSRQEVVEREASVTGSYLLGE